MPRAENRLKRIMGVRESVDMRLVLPLHASGAQSVGWLTIYSRSLSLHWSP